jgi:recombination associated protein RdgC
MGSIIKGNVSVTQFDVLDFDTELSSGFWDFINTCVRKSVFRDIDDTYDEMSCGWVSVVDMFDAEFSQNTYNIVDEFVVMKMRLDERKVAPAALKKFIKKEERRVMKENEVPKLYRARKIEIRDRVTVELTRKALPVPKCADVVWDVESKTIFLMSTTQEIVNLFENLFRETFGVSVMQKVPYTIAQNILSGDKDSLESLQPSSIA